MEITPQSRVGEIAASFPLATRVFARHRIDFCCGGGIPLVEVCARRGLDPEAVVAEIAAALAATPAPGADWNEAPLDELMLRIDREVSAHAGGLAQGDDQTVLLLRRSAL